MGVLGLVLLAGPAKADGQDVDGARNAFLEAERQFNNENYQLALEAFERAYELLEGDASRQVLVLFNIGRAHEELGDYGEAAALFRRYLREAPGDAPFREETQERILELNARVRAAEQAEGEDREESRPPSSSDGDALTVAGWVLVAVGGAAGVSALPTGLFALDAESSLEDACVDSRCPPERRETYDEMRSLSIATDVLWVAGVSIAAVGLILAIVSMASGDSEGARAACTGSAGCVLGGRF